MTRKRLERIRAEESFFTSERLLRVLAGVMVAACTTNTTVVQGGKTGGAACDYDNECASNSCVGGKGSGGGETSSGENGAGPESPSLRPLGTCASAATSSASGGTGGGPADAGGPVNCGEEGKYCKGNVLRSCATDQVVRDCATCKYVGPGTGSEYSTTCKDQAADCTTCNSSKPWSGPGCYFGGGPAVCR
jgi:hypothetical protein